MRGQVQGQVTMWAMLDWSSAPPNAPYSDAEDERILFLRDVRRWTWRRIAADIGRSSEAVVRKRYVRLSRIYEFDCASPVQPFSAQDDVELVRLREQHGWTWARIADHLGRPSGASVRMRYAKLQLRAAQRRTTRRQCIDCPTWFHSTGAGHRRCDPCRDRVSSTPWDM